MPNLRQLLTAAVTRRYPFFSGCGSLANSRFVKFISGTQGGKAWCRVPGGEVLADLDDHVGRSAFFVGELDRKITWICKQIVRNGDTVLDIGANIGMVTVLLSDLVGKNGSVHSFEPNPSLCDGINRTISHNGITNVTLHPIALGSKQDTVELIIPNHNRGAASMVWNKGRTDCDVVNVRVVPLDEICKNNKINSIRFIKIDVEGFENEVFLGAQQLLSTIQPDAILFELNWRTERQFSEEPLIKLLHGYGYDFFVIPKSIFRMKLQAWNLESLETPPGHDFLAAPRGQKFERVARLVKAIV
jgi:FkbM family methyltransferase